MRTIHQETLPAEDLDFGGGKDVTLAALSIGSISVAEMVPMNTALHYSCVAVSTMAGIALGVRMWRSESTENTA